MLYPKQLSIRGRFDLQENNEPRTEVVQVTIEQDRIRINCPLKEINHTHLALQCLRDAYWQAMRNRAVIEAKIIRFTINALL